MIILPQKEIFTDKDLSSLLEKNIPSHISKPDKLKILYRPFITPFAELINIIPFNSNVYEIGFGNGALLNLIYNIKKPRKLGGIEIEKKLVNNARDLLFSQVKNENIFNEKISLGQYDGVNLPDLHEFDWVLLVDVIHHIPKKQLTAFLLSIKRKMKSGATLIVKDIDASKTILVLFNKLHDLLVSREIGNEISMENAKLKLRDAGFTFESALYKRKLWYPHYTIITKA
jgi:protein-L-isoaspartate O-methyltransferase